MLKIFVDFIKNKEIRKKLLFTLFILFIYRLGCYIIAPGINDIITQVAAGSISGDINDAALTVLNMMSMLGGGALEQLSIFSLGVGPYITASIIIELLAMDIIPPLAEMAKSGKKGRAQMDRVTRYLGVVLAFVQGYFIVQYMNKAYNSMLVDNPGFLSYSYIALIFTAGTMFLLWLGDQITTKGVGNGVSVIIFSGIVADLPSNIRTVYSTYITADSQNWLMFIIYLLMYVAIIILVVVMDTAERRIPIQASTAQRINKSKGDLNHLPLKINSASVIPVIFAGALIQGPLIISSWFNGKIYTFLSGLFDFSNPLFLAFYGLLVILFTFFYTNLQVNPEKIAEDLGKDGQYIPGVRPGAETKTYVSTVLNRITVLGALLLCFIALLPYVISMTTGLPQSAAVGGTGIIIVVGTAMEMVKTQKGQLINKQYKNFIGK